MLPILTGIAAIRLVLIAFKLVYNLVSGPKQRIGCFQSKTDATYKTIAWPMGHFARLTQEFPLIVYYHANIEAHFAHEKHKELIGANKAL